MFKTWNAYGKMLLSPFAIISTVDIKLSFILFSILFFIFEMFHNFNVYIFLKVELAKSSSRYKVLKTPMNP